MGEKKLSLTFRLFRKFRLILNEEKYGNISPWGIVRLIFGTAFKLLVYKYTYSGILLENMNQRWLRAWLWRKIGVHVGKNTTICHRIALDYGNSHRLFIEDDVTITNGCTIICHKRNMKNYRKGDCILDSPYIYADVHLRKGCYIGMNTMIMPGVTVGEGAIVGACSVIAKDIPPWTVAVGSPAKVVKEIPPREEQLNQGDA